MNKKSPAEVTHDCDKVLIILAGIFIFLFFILFPVMQLIDYNECIDIEENISVCSIILK